VASLENCGAKGKYLRASRGGDVAGHIVQFNRSHLFALMPSIGHTFARRTFAAQVLAAWLFAQILQDFERFPFDGFAETSLDQHDHSDISTKALYPFEFRVNNKEHRKEPI